MENARLLTGYYAATALFVVLDAAFGVNIRVAFLEPWPMLRVAYYGFCFACLALSAWRPAWATWIGTGESLAVIVALIMSMGVHVMVPNDAIFDENGAIVTLQEIINFLLAGFIAYFAFLGGLRQLKVTKVV